MLNIMRSLIFIALNMCVCILDRNENHFINHEISIILTIIEMQERIIR